MTTTVGRTDGWAGLTVTQPPPKPEPDVPQRLWHKPRLRNH
jgi:hypothetical protein